MGLSTTGEVFGPESELVEMGWGPGWFRMWQQQREWWRKYLWADVAKGTRDKGCA
jgi:hypothetical protein